MVKRKDTIQTEVRNKEFEFYDRIDRGDTAKARQDREDAAPMAYDPSEKKQTKPKGAPRIIADPDAWMRSKNRKEVKRQALQRLKKDPTNATLKKLAGL